MITYNEEGLFIERYSDIISVKKHELIIQCKKYRLTIHGVDLLISAMTRDEIMIKGRIETVKFTYES